MRQQVDDAITDYLVLRSSQDFSARTLRNEKGVLMRFVTVNGNIWLHNVTERHAIRHFEEAGKTRSSNTLQLDHSVLCQFFEWARKTRRMALDCDPMAGRRRPRMTKRERNRLNVGQFAWMLDKAEEDDPRNRAVVAVLLYTLIRDQEASDLRIGDIDLDGGWLTVRITKSHQEDRMPICAELDTELRSWLTAYTLEVGALKPSHYLLPRRKSVGHTSDELGRINGHKMTYFPEERVNRLGRVVTPILEAAGFPVKDHAGRSNGEGAHTLRRSGARALFDALAASGYDHSLRIVQSMLHHASIRQTEVYIGITAERRSRDEILRGKPMYATDAPNLVRITV